MSRLQKLTLYWMQLARQGAKPSHTNQILMHVKSGDKMVMWVL